MTLCISFFSCTNLLYIYKMGMKSLFVQLDNSVVIAFITDHTAKSGILQILTKNQRIHVLHAVIFHLQNIKKEINALYSLKIFCPWKEEECHSDINKDIRYQCSSSVCWRTCWRNAELQFCQLPCLNNIWKWNKIRSGEWTYQLTVTEWQLKNIETYWQFDSQTFCTQMNSIPWAYSLALQVFQHLIWVVYLQHVLFLWAAEDPADDVMYFDWDRIGADDGSHLNLVHDRLGGHNNGSKNLWQTLTEIIIWT